MFKKILLIGMSGFLVMQSWKLMSNIHLLDPKGWWTSLFLAILINLFITGVFAFAGFALPTQKLLPSLYYKVHKPNNIKSLYQLFKVDYFRKFLLATFWKSPEQRDKYFNGKKQGIQNLITQSKKSEFGHLFPFLIITFITVYLATLGMIKLAGLSMLINIIFNFYPILLQRHHRMRVDRIFRRMRPATTNNP